MVAEKCHQTVSLYNNVHDDLYHTRHAHFLSCDSHPLQPDAVNAAGCTPLHVACNSGQDVVVEVLLKWKVRVLPLLYSLL